MNKELKGNLAMGASKTMSGFNENALKFLVPTWMSPWSGVAMRLGFGMVAFWIMGLFKRKEATRINMRQKLLLLGIGFVLMFGYMSFLLLGLQYTTPVVSSIFISTEPIWVFIMSVIFFREKITRMKVVGIILGFAGALLCILTQHASDVAKDPLLGAFYCLCDALIYSVYLIVSARVLKGIDTITVSKWTFTGGAISSALAVAFVGWDAPVISQSLFSAPMLALLFVLIFPTTVSYVLVDIGLKNLSPTVVALYGNVILVVAAIVSYALGQDYFSWFQVVAILLIIASMYFVEVAENRPSISAAHEAAHKAVK